jgi:hypothetical protein
MRSASFSIDVAGSMRIVSVWIAAEAVTLTSPATGTSGRSSDESMSTNPASSFRVGAARWTGAALRPITSLSRQTANGGVNGDAANATIQTTQTLVKREATLRRREQLSRQRRLPVAWKLQPETSIRKRACAAPDVFVGRLEWPDVFVAMARPLTSPKRAAAVAARVGIGLRVTKVSILQRARAGGFNFVASWLLCASQCTPKLRSLAP